MRVLGLDLGHHCGWCIAEDGVIWSGVYHFETLTRGEYFYEFRAWLGTKLHPVFPDLIRYERPFFRGEHTTRQMWGVVGIIELEGFRYGIGVEAVAPKALKKATAGSGNASKTQMKAAISKRIGRTVTDSDEADAIAVALYSGE